jgi:isoleucyl-tRNA synthetase
MDEVYHAIPGMKKESPQFEDMPKESHEYGEDVLAEFARFKKVRDVALKALEDARANGLIGQSSAGSLKLSLVKEDYDLLASFSSEELASNLIVASISLEEGKENKAEVVVAEGELCDRCRRIVPHTHEHGADHICDRCATALKGE